MNTPEKRYISMRNAVLCRDKNKCHYCGNYAGINPHVETRHDFDYLAFFTGKHKLQESDMITVCDRCRNKLQEKRCQYFEKREIKAPGNCQDFCAFVDISNGILVEHR